MQNQICKSNDESFHTIIIKSATQTHLPCSLGATIKANCNSVHPSRLIHPYLLIHLNSEQTETTEMMGCSCNLDKSTPHVRVVTVEELVDDQPAMGAVKAECNHWHVFFATPSLMK
jgi:hypothetical protein